MHILDPTIAFSWENFNPKDADLLLLLKKMQTLTHWDTAGTQV